jgi:hypothetical protein
VVGFPFGKHNSLTRAPVDDLALHVVQFVKLMSGSQPATVGELHPLHRNALRHPLILDGFLTTSRLAARHRELCLHVLSSFQRTGRSCPRPPSGLSSSGEPYNITNRIRPCQPLRTLFFAVPRHATSQNRPAPLLGHRERALESGWG